MEPDQMPEMPEMRGANMRQEKRPQKDMGKASPEIAAALVQRLGSMSEQELAMLDSVISPEVASVLMKLLPELAELIAAIEGGAGGGQAPMPRQMASEPQMGALGGMG
jgi:hypothetical protein